MKRFFLFTLLTLFISPLFLAAQQGELNTHNASNLTRTTNEESISITDRKIDHQGTKNLLLNTTDSTEIRLLFGDKARFVIDSSGRIITGSSHGAFNFLVNEDGNLEIQPNGAEATKAAMVFDDSTYNVGIGTYHATERLQINDFSRDSDTSSYLKIATRGTNVGVRGSRRAGIKLRHFKDATGFTIESHATADITAPEGLSIRSHFSDSLGQIRLFIDRRSENMGIRTDTATANLHLRQSSDTATGRGGMNFESAGSATNKWKLYHSGQHFSFAENTGTGILRAFINTGNGNYVQPSDGTLKKNIEPVEESILDKVLKLQAKRYHYKDAKTSEKKTLGFIAQEVQQLFPEIVYQSEEQQLGLSYADFGILAIKAIQEMNEKEVFQDKAIQQLKTQQELIEKQENTVKNQEEKIENLENKVEELTNLVKQLLTKEGEDTDIGSYVLPLEQKARLAQNQPNPFQQNTVVEYFVPKNVQNAIIQVTALDGKVLGTTRIDKMGKGQVTIKTDAYQTGTYFYSLLLDGILVETKRMTLTK